MSTSNISGGSVVVLVVFVFAGFALWDGVRDSDWLAKAQARSKYGVTDSKIQIEGTRPHDCDFLTAPIGEKHCSYEREYLADWFTLSTTHEPIEYGNDQPNPPTTCSPNETDFQHRCYVINVLGPDEHPTVEWHARVVEIRWRKVEE